MKWNSSAICHRDMLPTPFMWMERFYLLHLSALKATCASKLETLYTYIIYHISYIIYHISYIIHIYHEYIYIYIYTHLYIYILHIVFYYHTTPIYLPGYMDSFLRHFTNRVDSKRSGRQGEGHRFSTSVFRPSNRF